MPSVHYNAPLPLKLCIAWVQITIRTDLTYNAVDNADSLRVLTVLQDAILKCWLGLSDFTVISCLFTSDLSWAVGLHILELLEFGVRYQSALRILFYFILFLFASTANQYCIYVGIRTLLTMGKSSLDSLFTIVHLKPHSWRRSSSANIKTIIYSD